MEEEKIEPYYAKRAEELVDNLYDAEYVNPAIKREAFKHMEHFIAFLFQSCSESSVKAALFLERSKNMKKK